MPKLPQEIRILVDSTGVPFRLMVDGEEFPWYIAAEHATVDFADRAMPSVTITIPAHQIHVIEPEQATLDLGPEND